MMGDVEVPPLTPVTGGVGAIGAGSSSVSEVQQQVVLGNVADDRDWLIFVLKAE